MYNVCRKYIQKYIYVYYKNIVKYVYFKSMCVQYVGQYIKLIIIKNTTVVMQS